MANVNDSLEALWEEPAGKQFIADVLTGMLPGMKESAVVAQVVPDDPEGDVKFWVELGASIMLEKPIVAVVLAGRHCPEKLRRIADEIVEISEDFNAEDAAKMEAAFERVGGE